MIKEILKNNGITLTEFAQRLNISRPTLDNYIKQYEEKEKIQNEKYQIIFDMIFSNGIKNKEDFLLAINDSQKLIERDAILGTLELDAEKTDLLTDIIEIIKEDLYRNDCDLYLYRFILLFVNSYYTLDVFQCLVKYFLILNDIMPIEEIKQEDKKAISNYYKLFDAQTKNILDFDNIYYEKFVERVSEIRLEHERTDLIKKHIATIIESKLNFTGENDSSFDEEKIKKIIIDTFNEIKGKENYE